jgi:hypothetical protein
MLIPKRTKSPLSVAPMACHTLDTPLVTAKFPEISENQFAENENKIAMNLARFELDQQELRTKPNNFSSGRNTSEKQCRVLIFRTAIRLEIPLSLTYGRCRQQPVGVNNARFRSLTATLCTPNTRNKANALILRTWGNICFLLVIPQNSHSSIKYLEGGGG